MSASHRWRTQDYLPLNINFMLNQLFWTRSFQWKLKIRRSISKKKHAVRKKWGCPFYRNFKIRMCIVIDEYVTWIRKLREDKEIRQIRLQCMYFTLNAELFIAISISRSASSCRALGTRGVHILLSILRRQMVIRQ